MTFAWPSSPRRRADVVVGGAYVLVQLWSLFATLLRVLMGDRFHGRPNEVASLVFAVVLQLLCVVPGVGVMLADRRGFVLTLILSGMSFLGAMFQWLLFARQPSVWLPIMAGFELAVALFCARRLRGDRSTEDSEAESPKPPSTLIQSLDVAAGALNALPLIWLAGAFYMSRRTALPRTGIHGLGPQLAFAGLVLFHVLLCLGVVFGLRGAFVAMVIWLGLVLYEELQLDRSLGTPISLGLMLIVLLQGATLAYCVVRSRKAPPPAEGS